MFVRNSLLTVAVLLAAAGSASTARAQWDPLTGIKTGPGSDVEGSALYVGPQLWVQGGILDFLGDAAINGPVLIEEQNGWGAPIVNIAGTFNMNGPSFRVLNGARFTVNGATPGTVNTAVLEVGGGSQVTIGSAIVGNGLLINGVGSRLSL
ncbi:MAG: hypothetical protein KF787_12545, partial [Phycisphaeraceae bacterium]|nr:hypothetical protein [Phycisphaeraceae bacterium]